MDVLATLIDAYETEHFPIDPPDPVEGAALWMNIQARFDLETAEDVLAPQIRKIASYEAA